MFWLVSGDFILPYQKKVVKILVDLQSWGGALWRVLLRRRSRDLEITPTNADTLKIRAICVIRIIRDLRRTRSNATCIQTMAGHRDPALQEKVTLC